MLMTSQRGENVIEPMAHFDPQSGRSMAAPALAGRKQSRALNW